MIANTNNGHGTWLVVEKNLYVVFVVRPLTSPENMRLLFFGVCMFVPGLQGKKITFNSTVFFGNNRIK